MTGQWQCKWVVKCNAIIYDDVIQDLLHSAVKDLDRDAQLALWAVTDAGWDYIYDHHAGQDGVAGVPLNTRDIVRKLKEEVLSAAADYESPSLYRYILGDEDPEGDEDDAGEDEDGDLEEPVIFGNGLGALLGGGSWLSSGLTFDEETNAKAKPQFISTVANLKAASQDLREAMRVVVSMVVERFGAEVAQNMKPYVVRFIADVRDGKASLETENERGTIRGDGPQALDEVVAEEGGGTESGRRLGVDPADAGQVGRRKGAGTDATGLPAARG
ncbi:hypothetical protein [Pseudomonas fluorescens]|nr:hypothetical protein [Pseudomonas fluorescens]